MRTSARCSAGCTELASNVPASGYRRFRQAFTRLLAANAPTSDGLVGKLDADNEFNFQPFGGNCNEEVAAGTRAGARRLFAGTVRGNCGLEGEALLYGPSSPGNNAALFDAPRDDRIFQGNFEPLP